MAQSAKTGKIPWPWARAVAGASGTVRQQFSWIWTRESLLRLALSVILATALWLYVTGQQNPTHISNYPYAIPVVPQGNPSGLTVTNSIQQVHVKIQANRDVSAIMPTSIHAFVDLSHLGRGTSNAPVTVTADPGIQILSVTPGTVRVILDTRRESTVPVHVSIVSSPPKEYAYGSISFSPSTVTVSGPSEAVTRVVRADVVISLKDVRVTLNGPYSVILHDAVGATVSDQVSVSPSTVNVRVPIKMLNTFKTLPVVANISGTPAQGYGVVGVTSSPAEIVANGPPSTLSRLSAVSTQPISVSQHGGGNLSQKVGLKLPSGISANVDAVQESVTIAPVAGTSSVEVGVSNANLKSGLLVKTQPSTIVVTVRGPSTALTTAGRSMRATLDLKGLGLGHYTVVPRITAPHNLQILGVYPPRVNVTLSKSH